MDLTQIPIAELVSLRDKITDIIYSHEDGHTYICNVRSYGKNWKAHVTNEYALQELCGQYNGDDGIVDVYSTNPNLSHIYNYGNLMHIKSVEDYENWKEHQYLSRMIPNYEQELKDWDRRDEIPYHLRPSFPPVYTWEDVIKMKKELEEYDMSFTPPVFYCLEKEPSEETN